MDIVRQKIAKEQTGMSKDEVLKGIANGSILHNSQAVLWWGITPQEIAFIMPPPNITWGFPPNFSEEQIDILFASF